MHALKYGRKLLNANGFKVRSKSFLARGSRLAAYGLRLSVRQTNRTTSVSRYMHLTPSHVATIQHQKLANKPRSHARENLHGLHRLHGANHANERCQNAHGRAQRLWWRGCRWEDAGVAGRERIARVKHCDLPVHAQSSARDQRHAVLNARSVDGLSGSEVVAAVDHYVYAW